MSLPQRVLAIRLDTIGDVIMTTPALGAMVDAGSRVTLLTSSFGAALAPMLPYLERVLTLDVPWMKHGEERAPSASAQLRMIERLKAQRFDAAVIFTVSTQNPACAAYLAYLSDIPRVVSHCHGRLYRLVTDPVEDPDTISQSRHEVTRHLELVSRMGYPARRRALRLEIPRPTKAVRAVTDRLGDGAWCLVHPGASAQSRRYPVEQWSRVVDLLEDAGLGVVLAGGRQDRRRCDDIARGCRKAPIRADGRLTLPEFAALAQLASVAITCNSAASHVAAACNTPQVTLYAGTNSQHEPWSQRATVLRHETPCAWCLSSTCPQGIPACTASIPPAAVAAAALERAAG